MMSPEILSAFNAEMQKIAQEGGFVDAATAPFKQLRRLVTPSTAGSALQDLWHGSSNLHGLNRSAVSDEVAAANKSLAAKAPIKFLAPGGRYVDDIRQGQELAATLRRGGWLANYGKYEGPSIVRRGLNTVARHLPGQRTILLGGAALQAKGDLAKYDQTGRERGGAERALGTAGGLLGTAAGSSPAAVRAMMRGGLAGGLGGMIGGTVVGMGTSAAGKFLGRKIDQMRGFRPTEQPPQVQG
jgi:hypothetical protein